MKRINLLLVALTSFGLVLWGCVSEQEPLPETCLSDLAVNLASKSDANCGVADGSFTLSVTGGGGVYQFALNGGNSQLSPTFSGLAAGTYVVTVTDGDCQSEISVQILNNDGVNATLQANNSDCGNSTGSISVTATGGAAPYQYQLNNGSFSGQSSFTGLASGEYQVTVKDDNGCTVVLQTKVTTDVVFADIKSIIQTNCAVSGCHNGSVSPNFTNDSNIVNQASRIKSRTGAGTMPPASSGRSLSAEQVQAISCWVSDGASAN